MGVGTGLYMCDVVKKFTFAISSPGEFLLQSATTFVIAVFSWLNYLWFYILMEASERCRMLAIIT